MARAWAVFILASLAFFLSQFYRAANAVISPELLVDLSLDTEGLGLLSASFFYAFAITQIPISLLLDRVGPRRMMSALMLVGIAGAILFSMANDLTSGIAARVLMGAGMACNLMGTLKLLTLWFSPRPLCHPFRHSVRQSAPWETWPPRRPLYSWRGRPAGV
jgi:MFS family permease